MANIKDIIKCCRHNLLPAVMFVGEELGDLGQMPHKFLNILQLGTSPQRLWL